MTSFFSHFLEARYREVGLCTNRCSNFRNLANEQLVAQGGYPTNELSRLLALVGTKNPQRILGGRIIAAVRGYSFVSGGQTNDGLVSPDGTSFDVLGTQT